MRRSVKRRRKTEKRRRGGGAKIKWYLRTCDSCPLTHRSASVIDRERVFKKDWFRRAKIFFFFFLCQRHVCCCYTIDPVPSNCYTSAFSSLHDRKGGGSHADANLRAGSKRSREYYEMQNSYTSLGGRLFDWAAAIVRRGI